MKGKGKIVDIIWDYMKARGADTFGSGVNIRKEDINNSIFEIDGEMRISGEEDNNFSMLYVNYYEFPKGAERMMDYLESCGVAVDWYNPGYIVVEASK